MEEALKNGETLETFKARIAEAIRTQGWHDYRVENIFRTNMQTAYAAGRYKKMQAVKKSRPYWQYMAIMDRRVRPSPCHPERHGLSRRSRVLENELPAQRLPLPLRGAVAFRAAGEKNGAGGSEGHARPRRVD